MDFTIILQSENLLIYHLITDKCMRQMLQTIMIILHLLIVKVMIIYCVGDND